MRSADKPPKKPAKRQPRKRARGGGRKPKPTAMHKLEGTRPSKSRAKEPKPDLVDKLDAPSWLREIPDDGKAVEFFERVGRGLMKLGVLSIMDVDALAMVAENYSVYRRASKQLPKRFVHRKGAHRPIVFTIRRQALQDLKAGLAAFGLTPVDRAKVIAGDDVPLPPSLQDKDQAREASSAWHEKYGTRSAS